METSITVLGLLEGDLKPTDFLAVNIPKSHTGYGSPEIIQGKQ
jgi:hypothetical protein